MTPRLTERRWLVIAAAGAFAARSIAALLRSGPFVMADEAGYLGNARTLAGGVEIVMGSSPFYRSGYSLALVPLLRLDVDPELTYRLVLVLNAAMAASLVPLLFLLLTRGFGVDRRLALGSAVAGAAYPSITTLSQVALSENILFPLTVAWLLAVTAVARADRGHHAVRAMLVGAAAAASWLVHGRMVVVAGLTVLLVLALAARRQLPPLAAGAGLTVLGLGFAIGRLLDGFIVDRSYGGRRTDEVGDVFAPFGDLDGLLSTARNVVGQSWYLLVATFGLVVVFVLLEAVPAVRGLRDRELDGGGAAAVMAMAAAIGLLLISALWFDAATRPDQLVYGRYIEPILPPIIAIGLAALVRRTATAPVRRGVLAVLALSTMAVAVLMTTVDLVEGANRLNVASLPFVTGRIGSDVVAGAGVVAICGTIALLAASTIRPAAVWLVAVALFVPTTAFTEVTLILRAERSTYPAAWALPRDLIESGGEQVGYDLDHFHNVAVKAYQWHLPDTRFVLFEGSDGPPPTALFFSGPAWDREHPDQPATKMWDDPAREQALWAAR